MRTGTILKTIGIGMMVGVLLFLTPFIIRIALFVLLAGFIVRMISGGRRRRHIHPIQQWSQPYHGDTSDWQYAETIDGKAPRSGGTRGNARGFSSINVR